MTSSSTCFQELYKTTREMVVRESQPFRLEESNGICTLMRSITDPLKKDVVRRPRIKESEWGVRRALVDVGLISMGSAGESEGILYLVWSGIGRIRV